VVENGYLIAVFWAGRGRMIVYSKADAGRKTIEFTPLQMKQQSARISRCEVLRNAGDEVALDVTFSASGQDCSAVLAFDKTRIVEIRPTENMKGISLASSIEYGVAPSFVGDDLILAPAQFASASTLYVPAENVFLGLTKPSVTFATQARPYPLSKRFLWT